MLKEAEGWPALQVMEFPVVMLVRFWANHHLLDLFQRPVWRVVKDRSRTYVQKILAGPPLANMLSMSSVRSPAVALLWLRLRGRFLHAELPDVRLGCPVTSATPAAAGQRARVSWGACQSQEFDAVIFATHSDTTLSMLGEDAPQVPYYSLAQLLS